MNNNNLENEKIKFEHIERFKCVMDSEISINYTSKNAFDRYILTEDKYDGVIYVEDLDCITIDKLPYFIKWLTKIQQYIEQVKEENKPKDLTKTEIEQILGYKINIIEK